MNDMYRNGTYLENNATWHVQDSPWKAEQVLKMLDRHALRPRRICEVGCGAGEILRQLHQRMPVDTEFDGYDISPQAYELCRAREQERLHFHLADLLEEDVYYDLVMAIDVFEHIEDFYGFLRRLRGKGEYKLFHIPLDLSVQTVLRMKPILHIRKTAGHIHYFTKDTALASLQHAGYEIIDHFYTGSALELPKRGLSGNLMKIPRRLFSAIDQDLAVRVLGGYSLMVLAR